VNVVAAGIADRVDDAHLSGQQLAGDV
jgi:hypothetical protein